MSEFKVDRRTFLQMLGAAGATGAVATVRFPADMTAIAREANENRPSELWGRPFWVKAVPEVTLGMGEMTGDYQRWNPARDQFHSWSSYVGEAEAGRVSELGAKNEATWMKEGKPGFSLRDIALSNGANLVNMSNGPYGGADVGLQSWQPQPWTMGLREKAQALGVTYDVTPEEAARDVKAAARLYGSAITGITTLDTRLVYEFNGRGQAIFFEDVEAPFTDEEKCVIPSRFNRVVAIASRMSPEAFYRSPSQIGSAAADLGYSSMTWTSGMVAEFIRSLGYHAVPLKNDFCSTVAFGVLAGLGELGRTNRLVTPEYGPMVRLSVVLTDMPLALDGPIDAGIAEFCTRCKKCAESCPSGALSFEDNPSFDVPQGYEWVNAGHKAWWPDQTKCYSYWGEITTGCGICHAVCPWGKKDKAWLHDLSKTTAAATPMFDSFMRRMDDAFGYGLKNSDDEQKLWWELDLPEYGLDTTQAHKRI